jgi:hypothetical protein
MRRHRQAIELHAMPSIVSNETERSVEGATSHHVTSSPLTEPLFAHSIE